MWTYALELLGLLVEAGEVQEARRKKPHYWLYEDDILSLYDYDVSSDAGRRKYGRRYERALRRLRNSIEAQPTGDTPARSCDAYADTADLLAAHFRKAGWTAGERRARDLRERALRAARLAPSDVESC